MPAEEYKELPRSCDVLHIRLEATPGHGEPPCTGRIPLDD